MPAAADGASVAPASAAALPFDAVLYPNRSLGTAGFYSLMAAIVTVSAGVGAAFVLAGAWPVSGFLGLDVLLLYLAFRWNYRDGRLTDDPPRGDGQLVLSSHGDRLVIGAFLTAAERREVARALEAALRVHQAL